MRRMLRGGGVMLALVALATAFAAGQNPQPKAGDAPALPQTGEVTGKLVMAGGSSKGLVVAVELQMYEPNPNAARTNNTQLNNLIRQQVELQRHQAELMRARNPREQMQRMHRVQQDLARLQLEMARLGMSQQQQPFKVVTKRQDFEVQTDDHTKVRFKDPPTAYDDKGNPKKYTAAELKELAGNDPRIPGYKGDFDQLRPGHIVKVTLGKRPTTKAGKDLDKAPVDDDKPYATLVLVTGEDTPPPKKKK